MKAQSKKSSVRRKRPELTEGMRVRLIARPPGMQLQSDTGTIVGPDEFDGDMGYYVVRLDIPAPYDHGESEAVVLNEIVELTDNLEVVRERSMSQTAEAAMTGSNGSHDPRWAEVVR